MAQPEIFSVGATMGMAISEDVENETLMTRVEDAVGIYLLTRLGDRPYPIKV